MRNIVYPYTCPFFIPSEHNQNECDNYSDVYWTEGEFLDGLHLGNSEMERKSIEIHIRRFFERKLIEQKGGNGG